MRPTRFEIIDALPLPDHEWEKDVPYLFDNMTIVIEYLPGDKRTKVSSNGMVVSGIMPAAYGFILRTTDAHGEELDMYLAPLPVREGNVYVIDQVNPQSRFFDEHKVMLGYDSPEEAIHTYTQVFSDGSGEARIGAITCFTPDAFVVWLHSEGATLKASSDYTAEGAVSTQMAGVNRPPKPKDAPAPRDEAGGVMVELADLSGGPKIKTLSLDGETFDHHLYLYSALDQENWSVATDTFCRLLDLATQKDTVRVHIASPGGSVFLMGRIKSAMDRTQARVITYAEGCVASAATTIWASGHERHILPGAYFMQHMSSQLLTGKTTDIAAKAVFCKTYIENQLGNLLRIGLFTQEEIDDMVEKSSDIYISGREAIARVGQVS